MPLGKSCPGEGQFLHLTTEAPLQPRVGPECKGHRLRHSNSICGHWGAMEQRRGWLRAMHAMISVPEVPAQTWMLKACVGRSMCDGQGSFQTALPWAPSLAPLGAVSWQAVLC